jgi:hypothetical protein
LYANVCVAVGAVMLLASGVRAESIQCVGSRVPDNKSEYAFRIVAGKTGMPKVWFAFDPAKLLNTPAEVLHHFYTGIDGASGLGVSTILVRQRDENGQLMVPAMIAVDWTTARLSVSYMPILSNVNLLVIRDHFDCARLD